jgi:hypothetical protein
LGPVTVEFPRFSFFKIIGILRNEELVPDQADRTCQGCFIGGTTMLKEKLFPQYEIDNSHEVVC